MLNRSVEGNCLFTTQVPVSISAGHKRFATRCHTGWDGQSKRNNRYTPTAYARLSGRQSKRDRPPLTVWSRFLKYSLHVFRGGRFLKSPCCQKRTLRNVDGRPEPRLASLVFGEHQVHPTCGGAPSHWRHTAYLTTRVLFVSPCQCHGLFATG